MFFFWSFCDEDPRDWCADVAEGEIYKVRVGATTVNGTGPFSAWEKVAIPVANKSESGKAGRKDTDE